MRASYWGPVFWITQLIVLACAQRGGLIERTAAVAAASPTPISVSPAQNWDGPDGPWSSFTIRLGTPAQDLRVLISTAVETTWVVLPQGCPANDTSCPSTRGEVFNQNASTSWAYQGTYLLYTEQNLGIRAEGYYGNDTLGLGIQGSGGPTLENQPIAGIGTENFYVGMFGVNPKPTNYTGLSEGQSSFMTSLKNQSMIPSVSFGYSAGAKYRLKQVDGSLTLGGYDQSRFTPNSLSFSFAPDSDRDIVVGVQSIIATEQNGRSHDLLPSGINAYVDSTVSQIWLPVAACLAFETAFGLTYDNQSALYLVNDTLHASLLKRNPSISFALGNSSSGGQTVNITLPYASFDLQVTPPLVTNAGRYFPLQRAANETQYTLGRTFLQEAYLIVDWERSNFSISQCLFNDNTQQNIAAIDSAHGSSNPIITKSTGNNGSSNHREVIGIAVGVVLVIIIFVGGVVVFVIMKRRKRRREAALAVQPKDDAAEAIRQGFAKAELDTDYDHARYEMGGPDVLQHHSETPPAGWVNEKAKYPGDRSGMAEVPGDAGATEFPGDEGRVEIPGEAVGVPELASRKGFPRPLHEMYDPSAIPVELPADTPSELPGSALLMRSQNAAGSSRSSRSGTRSPLNHSVGASPLSQPSPINRRQEHPPQLRSPTSQPCAPSPGSRASKDPSLISRSAASTLGGDDAFSPISPLGVGGTSPVEGGMFSFVRGLSQPVRTRRESSRQSARNAPPRPAR